MSNEEIFKSWVAGFFEGEGSIIITKRPRNSYGVRVSLTQKVPEPLEAVSKIWGGKVFEQFRESGRIFRWRLSNKKALRFLKDIEPYLVFKKEAVSIGIALETQKEPRGVRHEGNPLSPEVLADRERLRLRLLGLNRKEKVKEL